MKESKFGMDSPTAPGDVIRAPWAMKVTVTTDGIEWKSEAMSGEFIHINPHAGFNGTVVGKGAILGKAIGPRVRFQISDIDPRLIFKLIEMLGML